MRTLIGKLFDFREGEVLKASLMFAYIFMIIAAQMILKPVRNSLFLVRFGAGKLPYVFMLVSLSAAAVASVVSRFHRRLNIVIEITVSLAVAAASLFLFWLLLSQGYRQGWLFFAFYVWVSIFSVVSATHFWLLANYVYNAREAKRLFGFIGAGGISGAIFGGYFTSYLAPRLRTENLVFPCIGLLALCTVILWVVKRLMPLRAEKPSPFRKRIDGRTGDSANPLRLILRSRHLSYLAALVGLGVVVANIADYQFNAVASQTVTVQDDLTAFFGFWLSNLNIAALAVQLFFTGRVIKRFGVSASLFFLPVGLLGGTLAMLIYPGLSSAIFIKVSDGAFKHSINRAGTELLALPIPHGVKEKAKSFIDIVMKNFATGVAGLMLLALTSVLGMSIQYISIVSAVLIAFWLIAIARIKGEYVNAFRLAILKRSIDLERQPLNVNDASVLESITRVLDGDNERQILYILNFLDGVRNQSLVPYIEKLTEHPSDEIKAAALRMAKEYEEIDMTSRAAELVESGYEILRVVAVDYMCRRSADPLSTLRSYLESDRYLVKHAAMICAADMWKVDKSSRDTLGIKEFLESEYRALQMRDISDEERRHFLITAAGVIGISGDPELYPYLGAMFNDRSIDLVVAAIKSAGMIKAPEFVPFLVRFLKISRMRRYAREALASYGEPVIETLASSLENPREDIKTRMAIPRVLSMVDSPKSVDILLRNLEQQPVKLLHEIIRALNRLRMKYSSLPFGRSLVRNAILSKVKLFYRLVLVRSVLHEAPAAGSKSGPEEPARRLLIKAIEEKLGFTIDEIFRLMGLRYNPRDVYNAYLGITSKRPALRANSVEFLDNVLEPGLKAVVIPIIELSCDEIVRNELYRRLDLERLSFDESVRFLLNGDDGWLKSCALFLIAETGQRQFSDTVSALVRDEDVIVKETARFCTGALSAPS